MSDPMTLPPGPQRRDLLRQLGRNIGPDDFTPDEWAEIKAQSEADGKIFDEMRARQ